MDLIQRLTRLCSLLKTQFFTIFAYCCCLEYRVSKCLICNRGRNKAYGRNPILLAIASKLVPYPGVLAASFKGFSLLFAS